MLKTILPLKPFYAMLLPQETKDMEQATHSGGDFVPACDTAKKGQDLLLIFSNEKFLTDLLHMSQYLKS